MTTSRIVERVEALRAEGSTVAQACRRLGVSPATYYRRRRALPTAVTTSAPLPVPAPRPRPSTVPPAFADARDWRTLADAELDDAAVWRLDPSARVARARMTSSRSAAARGPTLPQIRLRGRMWRAACAVTPLRVALQAGARATRGLLGGFVTGPAGLAQAAAAAALVGLAALTAAWGTLAAANPTAWSLIEAPSTASLVIGEARAGGPGL